MLAGLEQISKDVYLKDDDIIGLAKRLTEHIRYSAHISAVYIFCKLSKCSLQFLSSHQSYQVQRGLCCPYEAY